MSDFTQDPDALDPLPAQPALGPPAPPAEATTPTAGCMTCKAQRPYMVEPYTNGNTGWRCTGCGNILHLVTGPYAGLAPRPPQPCTTCQKPTSWIVRDPHYVCSRCQTAVPQVPEEERYATHATC